MYSLYYHKPKKYSECVKLSYPLLMKLLEYAHESSSGDADLHWILERIIKHGADGTTLTMEHYSDLIPESRLVTVEVKPGQKLEVESINE